MQNHVNFKTTLPAPAAVLSVLHYHAPWSPPCRRQCLVLQELARDCRQPLEILSVDVEAFAQLAESTTIQSIPTISILHFGRERRRLVGLQPLEGLRQAIAEVRAAALHRENMLLTHTSFSSTIQE